MPCLPGNGCGKADGTNNTSPQRNTCFLPQVLSHNIFSQKCIPLLDDMEESWSKKIKANRYPKMKKAFTLIEILIVVAILGILAAIALPTFKGHMTEARESAAKDILRILRNAIELYAAQHNGVPPGYAGNDPSNTLSSVLFFDQMVFSEHYLSELPENPFNGKRGIKMIANNEDFPTAPVMTDVWGWIYKPATKTIKLNWQGNDSAGVAYYQY